MVAIFVGHGAGLERGSGSVLGGAGVIGNASHGRGGEAVHVNAATGNLILQRQDEFLVGRGPDSSVTRTYNSLAEAADDNGDQWRFGAQRKIQNLVGTLNTAGSTVERVDADGSVIRYDYDVSTGAYITKEGGGARDKLVYNNAWIWTDGNSQAYETYETSGNLLSLSDTVGNRIDYTYQLANGVSKLHRATTANGEYQEYQWAGANVTQVITGYTDLTTNTAKQLTRVRYSYDGQNRLSSVTTDLSPENNSISDGHVYVISYSYDGTSKRVATIAQSDGSLVAIAYDATGRVTSLTETVSAGVTRTTSLTYGDDHTLITDPLGQVTRLDYVSANSIVSSSFANWLHGNVVPTTAAPIDGNAATRYTVQTNGQWSGIYTGYSVTAGDTLAYAMSVRGTDTSSSVSLGLFGDSSGWAPGDLTTARIVSGPGTIVNNGGLWSITGLSPTEATRIEMTRRFVGAESGAIYFYPDLPQGWRTGAAIDVADPVLTRTSATGNITPTTLVDSIVNRKQLSRITLPASQAGGKSQYTEFVYNAAGDLIETRTGTVTPDLLDKSGWAGAQRGANLIDLSGWAANPDALPSGSATVANWINAAWTTDEARWAKAIGPDGTPVSVIQVGQTDTAVDGGGNYTHSFAVDTNKAYEYVTYFQVTELNKHRVYFGLSATASVVPATGGAVEDNPYFAYPLPDAASGIQVGRWYKIVAYVLPSSSGNLDNYNTLGGIYDVDTGERISEVTNFRWASSQPANPESQMRFFNHYGEDKQGYFTNYYKPEVREINLEGGKAAIDGWDNTGVTDETRWAATLGPDGNQVFAIQSGQTINNQRGGGNHSSQFAIDRSKAYEFTYYFKMSNLDRHPVYFGLSGQASVEDLATGTAFGNPYFYIPWVGTQAAKFIQDRWYKVTAWVLPSGSESISPEQLGGVYDTVTGDRVDSVHRHFRWASSGGSNTSSVRFFNYYYENDLQYSTYFYKPEVREATGRAATANGSLGHTADNVLNRSTFEYDNNGNLIQSVDSLGNVVTRTYGARNELLTETRTGSDETGAAVSLTTRYAYDAQNLLRFTVSAAGQVTEYYRNGFGENYWTVDYPQAVYDVSGLAPSQAITDVQLHAWKYGFTHERSKIDYQIFDARGGVRAQTSYGKGLASWGNTDTTEGYSHNYFTYDQAGRLLNHSTYGHSGETFVYDGLGRVVAATDTSVGTTTYVFNDAATTTTVTLANGQVTTSSYDKTGNLLTQNKSNDWSAASAENYQYDTNDRLRVKTDAGGNNYYYVYDRMGRLTAEIAHYGQMVEYRYDALGRQVASIRYYYTPTSTQLTALANPANPLTVDDLRPAQDAAIWSWTVYDKLGRVTGTIDGDGSVTAYSYDAAGRLIKTQGYATHLSAAQVVAYRITSPATVDLPPADTLRDTLVRSFYDRDGRLIGTLNGEGFLTRNVYDKAGQLVREVAFANAVGSAGAVDRANASFNQLTASVAASGDDRSVNHVYDGQGFKRYTINAIGQATEYVYAGNNQGHAIGVVRTTIQHAVPITPADYSFDGVKAALAPNAANAANRTSWAVYDAAGRLAYAIDADGGVVHHVYDNLNQVIRTIAFAAKRATSALPTEADMNGWRDANIGNVGNRITRNWYTQKGQLKFTVDAEGYLTRHDYDAKGQTTASYRWDVAQSVNDATTIGQVDALQSLAGGYTTLGTFAYDNLGRVAYSYDGLGTPTRHFYRNNGEYAEIIEAVGTNDERSEAYRAFNHAGQVRWQSDAWGTAEQFAEHNYYDALGNLRYHINGRGHQTAYNYDRAGNLISVTDATGGITRYEYNAFGEVVKTTDARGNSSYTHYDVLGRVVANRDAENFVTTTSYTVFGEVAASTRYYSAATNAASVNALPTVTGHALDLTISYSYDKLGRVIAATEGGTYTESFTYTAFGEVASKVNKLGGVTDFAYDRRGLLRHETVQMTSWLSSGAAQATSITSQHSYDSRGNRIQTIEAQNLVEQRTSNFTYDRANRLIATQRDVLHTHNASGTNIVGSRVDTIKYDLRGNIIETIDALGARTLMFYDDLDRKVVEINAAGTYSAYAYDANGNILTMRVYANAVSLPASGGAAALAPAVPGGEVRQTSFTYDALNRMLTSSVDGVATGTWNGSNYVTTTGSLTTSYTYDAAGNVTSITDPNGGVTYRYYDKMGRKTAELDAERYLTTWTYDNDSDVLNEIRFANRFTGTPTVSTLPTVASAGVTIDRSTGYVYDKFGNRTAEVRHNVTVHNGAGGTTLSHSQVSYAYNGLGQVITRTEQTAEGVSYTYDNQGRLLQETSSAFVGHQGSSVTPTKIYRYDGLGNMVRSEMQGAGDAAAQITRYNFGAGGILDTVSDPGGFTTYIFTDLAGRSIGSMLANNRADGREVRDFDISFLDALGREYHKAAYQYDGRDGWDFSSGSLLTGYTAYGEVAWHEGDTFARNKYDAAGRLWATNAGDGAWKYFGYDKNGNQTIAITSAGADLSNLSFAQVLALVGQEDVNATYTVYDQRNMAVQVVEEGRRSTSGGGLSNVTTSRAYNAFGDVASETNALGHAIIYTYDTAGKLQVLQSPAVTIVNENGAQLTVNPTEYYYYDASGRLVAQRDANGNLTRRVLLVGTGYQGSEAQVVQEIAADGGVRTMAYDVQGNVRTITDQIGRVTTQSYDARGLLTQINHASGLIDNFSYDGRGQQIARWNNLNGASDKQLTDYDAAGRVVYSRAIGGDVTTTSYEARTDIATPGLGTFGGWRMRTTHANGLISVEDNDVFGRGVSKTDMGGNVTTYGYDVAGRLISSNIGGAVTNSTYFNSGAAATVIGPGGSAFYGYDLLGQRVSELFYKASGEMLKNQSATYDALGRMTAWVANATIAAPAASTNWSYDANGNIRRVQSSFAALDAFGGAVGSTPARDDWFRFDAMNRLVVDRGALTGTAGAAGTNIGIENSLGGTSISYDLAGQRITTLTRASFSDTISIFVFDDPWQQQFPDPGVNGHVEYENVYFDGYKREDYTYNNAGNVTGIRFGQSAYQQTQQYYYGGSVVDPTGPGTLRSSFTYDLLGRQLTQVDKEGDGTTDAFSRSVSYNARGQLSVDDSTTRRARTGASGYDSLRTITRNDYDADGHFSTNGGTGYALGQVVWSHAQLFKNGQDGDIDDTLTRNDYAWRDGAVTTGIIHDRHHDWTVNGGAANQINPGNFDQDWTTSYGFDGLGQLSSATIADGRARAIAFTNDENGQIIRRDESGSIAGQSGNPHEVWYRYGGRQLGYSGNNGTAKLDTQASINERQAAAPGASSSGTFRGGGNVGSSYADFAQSYDPLNSYGQGSGSGAYTASAGDTLSSIAQSIWGDANLWYKIAAANGLSGDAQLSEGQQLSLPSGVTRSSFNAQSITPYDAGSAIGDTSPTTAKPPKSNKCATMGMLMLAVVAIAVTAIATAGVGSALTGASFSNALGAVTGGALTGFGTATTVLTGFGAAASAATGAAIGAAVSQGLGVATGIQSKFSFKGVALAALSAGLGQGVVGGVSAFGGTSTAANIGNAAVRGVVGSALSQGIGVATGLQSKFSFAGVAAAGVAAGVGAALGGRLPSLNDNGSAGNIASHLAVGGARLIASAATRSALEGSSFGRNITAGLPDVLAQTLVDSAVGAARRGGGSVRERADGGGASTGGVNMGALESAVARATAGWEETIAAPPIEAAAISDIERAGGYENAAAWAPLDGGHYFESPRPINIPSGHLPTDAEIRDALASSETINSRQPNDDSLPRPLGWLRRAPAFLLFLPSPAGETEGFSAPIWGMAALIRRQAGSPSYEISGGSGERLGFVSQEIYPDRRNLWSVHTNQGERGSFFNGVNTFVYRNIELANGEHIRVGFGVNVQNEAEARIVDEGIRRGLDSNEINSLLDISRQRGHVTAPTSEKVIDYYSDSMQAPLPRVRLSAATRAQIPAGSPNIRHPHDHHILPVNGRRGEERALVREGQGILLGVRIDPLHGLENLVRAPNHGHTIEATRGLVLDLRAAAGNRERIERVLFRHGRIAQGRGRSQ